MTELLTAEAIRAVERAAMDAGGVTGLQLMERAGRGAVDALLDWRPSLAAAPGRAVVLCGPGNNGGDGFVVARILTGRGWSVEVFLLGRDPDDPDALPPDAAANARALAALAPVRAMDDAAPAEAALAGADLVVDALFGTGLGRPVADLGAFSRLCRAHLDADGEAPGPAILALDVPSGLCADSGRAIAPEDGSGHAPAADLTVTFHRAKPGHYLAEGPRRCGALAIVDIGLDALPPAARAGASRPPRDAAAGITLVESPAADRRRLRRLGKRAEAHKYDHGHALVLAGGVGRGGAARLAARGALRVGAGLVTVGCPPAALIENAARLDAIMLRPVGDADALDRALADPRIAAVCLGPGLGTGETTRAMVRRALHGSTGGGDRPGSARPRVVLDADALTAFEDRPGDLLDLLHDGAVLTPHPGEFARLFPGIAADLSAPAARGPAVSRIDAVRDAAARAGCTVLLKGADTVIATPDGAARIHAAVRERAAPWLATAGAGDVLAGLVTGLLARGLAPADAAETAAWLHVEAARRAGPGLVAEDLPEALPGVLRDLGA